MSNPVPNQNEPSLGNRSHSPLPAKRSFTIKAILVITVVFAVAALNTGYLYQAVMGTGDNLAMGRFVIFNAMLPMALLVAASWFFRFVDFVTRNI